MDVGGRGRRAALAAAVLVLASVGLVACNGGGEDPTLTPTVEPTPSPTPPSEEQLNTEAAAAGFEAFVDTLNAAAAMGFDPQADPELAGAVLGYTVDAARDRLVAEATMFNQNHLLQEGDAVISSLEPTEYTDDGTHEVSIAFAACIDNSGVALIQDGSPWDDAPERPSRETHDVLMVPDRGPDHDWYVAEFEPLGQSC